MRRKTRKKRTSVARIIGDRQGTHGVFRDNSVFIQAAKDLMRGTPNWSRMPAHQRECLDMQVHKIGRALFGDPDHRDHWIDQVGYITRVVEYLDEDR